MANDSRSSMDQTDMRKTYSECKHSTNSDSVPSGERSRNKKKSRHKKDNYHSLCPQSFDSGFTPYSFNVPHQTRIHHPSSQRLCPTLDPSICHYQVPLSFSLEHVPFPFYSTLVQPGSASAAPIMRINRTGDYNKTLSNFQTYKHNNEGEQDCLSLPPTNCDLNPQKTKEEDSTYRRRFSDPGIAQMSDDCNSSSRSSGSNSSSVHDLHMPYAFGLIEQVNELRESNSHLMRELHETKLELESLKILSATWRQYSESIQPGKLSDSIVEVRDAIRVNEEAMLAKMMQLFEKNTAECKEDHRRIEEALNQRMNDRLTKLEEDVQSLAESLSKTKGDAPVTGEGTAKSDDVLAIQQQLVISERERLVLRKELQEAIDSRKKAEANTLKLERLVSLLRKKINGVSLESCMTDDKQMGVRPLAISFEQNPFVQANNKHIPKPAAHHKRSLGHRKSNPDLENGSGGNEVRDSESGAGTVGSSASDGPATAPQMTITGPVTDL